MISWTTKTLFQGLFPIPSYKVKQAMRKHEDIHCFLEGTNKVMILKEMDLRNTLPLKESLMFDDKSNINGGKPYNLLYYKWNPKTDDQRTKELLYF